MGLENLTNNVNTDNLRMERENRVNPAEYPPTEQNDEFFDDGFSSGATETEGFENFSESNFGSFESFGQDSNAGFNQGNQMPMQMTQQPQNSQMQAKMEEAMFTALSEGAKGSFNFLKEFGYSLRMVTPKFWASWGSSTTIAGLVVAGSGLIMVFFKKSLGMSMMISGLLSSAIGFLTLMFNLEKARQLTSRYIDGVDTEGLPQNLNNTTNETGGDEQTQGDDPFSNNDFGGDFGNSDNFDSIQGENDDDDWDLSDDDDEDGDMDLSDDDDEEDWSVAEDDNIWNTSDNSNSGNTGMDIGQALDELNSIERNVGMLTRQFLYEQFTKVLKSFKSDYKKVTKYTPEDDIFIIIESLLGECCETEGVGKDNLPVLEELSSSLFQIKLYFTTPPAVSQAKAETIGNNFLQLYAHRNGIDERKLSIKVKKIAKHTELILYTCESAMISLLDTYNTDARDFVLNTKNYMPVVVGVREDGRLVMCDFKDIESMLIAGMPRSGKSWVAKLILTQMCAFVPPSELNIYICDPKAGISDFFSYTLPHVKRFASTDLEILNIMRYIVNDLAPKRKKIIGDAGLQTIWEYREANPNEKMPVIYVVIDEVVTLADRMDKEIKDEFQGLLRELISQLPALGIRAILIPHVIKDQIISKTTTDLINCRISVLGDADHIESTTGAKNKQFTQKLTTKGDMAVKMVTVDSEVMFAHAPVLCKDNPECNQLFNYMTQVWAKIEPEEYESSYHYRKNKGLLNEPQQVSTPQNTPAKPQRVDNPVIQTEDDMSLDVDFGDDDFSLDTEDIDVSFATEPNRQGLSGFDVANVEDDDDFLI